MQGIIVKYNSERGFGFLRRDGSRTDVFFHKTAMTGGAVPAVDMIMEFVPAR